MNVKSNAVRLFSIAAVLLGPAAYAQSQPDEAAATAHRLMVRSGLSVQLRGFSDQVAADIRNNAANADPQLIAALAEAAREAFRAELLQEDMTARIAKKLTVSDMKAALVWLETEPGKRVTRAEENDSISMDAERIGAYVEGLKTSPLSADRQKLIAELISVTGSVRVAMATTEAMALGVAVGMDALQPQEHRVGEATLRARIRQAMPPEKMQAAFAQQMPLLHAYTYRNTSDADLAGYVGFLKSVAGKRYQDQISAAFVEGLGRASVRVGELAAQRQRQTKL